MTGTIRLIACLVLCLAVGFLNGLVTYPEIPGWYATLKRPSWTPPSWVFPVAWNILYVMMGTSLWLLWDRASPGSSRTYAIVLFGIQLALNAAWSPVFFAFHQTRVALGIIIALAIAIAATIAAARKAHPLAAWLLVPYLAWVIYATTLNAGVVVLNP